MHSSRHPDSAAMLLSRLRFPVVDIGYGMRAEVWLPGCRVFCRDCLAEHTWVFDESTRCGVGAVLDWLRELPADRIDGVTICGGEPSDRPAALRALIDGINTWRTGLTRPVDLLLYSGRSTAVLDERLPWLSASVDALVAERFDAGAGGPASRRVVVSSALGMTRYAAAPFAADVTSCDSCGRPAPSADTTGRTVGTGRSR
ncbi:4Fe-4S cluster-binding domain-containing protein [Nocardia suismassiliense]|uniref:4Fe-4S cluster-binding domain-containing protein n=1 Tax=Nocardia suismassiliense TaxID=2077092 RepID=UPI00131EF1C1|nr:4Fe-4S cluster-binding domain-containing protein [Nocardia suismassiliense]